MNDRVRARSAVERALTDIDIREDRSAIQRLGVAATLLAECGGNDVEGEDLPEFEELIEHDQEVS